MGFFIQNYQSFSGNAIQLADLAINCAKCLSLPGDSSKISERLIRYYVTEGLLSRPIRIGRDAEYGYKHLQQFLASRSLMEQGYPMQKVADYISGLDITQLEPLALNQNKPSLAELLVASFKQTDKSSLKPYRPTKTGGYRSSKGGMDSVPMMTLSSIGDPIDKNLKKDLMEEMLESYKDGMRKTGVVNTKEIMSELRLEMAEVKTIMSDIVNGLSAVVQPSNEQESQVLIQITQKLTNDLGSFCQKMESTIHNMAEKQSYMLQEATMRSENIFHKQQIHMQRIEEMFFQFKNEVQKSKK